MTDVSSPIKVSGVPLNSRAGRRIRAHAGGPAEQLGSRMRRIPSLLVSWIVADAGAVLLASVMVVLGLFVTKALLAVDAIATADDWLPVWVEDRRTPFLTDLSYVGSMLADRPILVPLFAVVLGMLVLRRRWRMAAFLLQAALVELLCYALVVHFVTRNRPPVEQLDVLPVTDSFPSGHVAMSVAAYGALALLLAAHFRDIRIRVAVWSVAALFPVMVAASRIYRGEHHPIDVLGGVFMGLAALCIAVFAARTARHVAEIKARHKGEVRP